MSILTSVTEIEDRVVDTVRSIQHPVVDYVRKSVERAEGRLPKLAYPENLPKPGEVVDSQINFAKALLDAQREFLTELVDAVAPLVQPEGEPAAESEATQAPATAAPAKPRAKTAKKTTLPKS